MANDRDTTMTLPDFAHLSSWLPALLPLTPWALAGLVIGAWHFASLRWLSRRLLAPSGGTVRLAGLYLLRVAVLVAACTAAARQGAGPLLALATGLLLARLAFVAHARRPAMEPA